MKKIIWVYGIIAGLIMGAMFFITVPFYRNGTLDMENGMWVGYTTMVIALSLVFFGTKSYRDNQQNGTITFGRAFKVGILITVVASLLYALSWEVAYHTVFKGFSEGMTEENKIMYENPFFRFPMSLMEVFPVGVIVTLISSGLLRKKRYFPLK